LFLQSVITEINNQIGASGVLSKQCKAVAAQYGEMIIEKLIAKVFDWVLL
jgi:phytepsin